MLHDCTLTCICVFLLTYWHQLLLLTKYYSGSQIMRNVMANACGTYRRHEGCIKVFGGENWGKESLRRPRRRQKDNTKMDLHEVRWTGMAWFRIGTADGHLWMRSYTYGFHKMRGISRLVEDLSASQQGVCSMELDINNKKVVAIRKSAVDLSLVMCDKTQNLCADRFLRNFLIFFRGMTYFAVECAIKGRPNKSQIQFCFVSNK